MIKFVLLFFEVWFIALRCTNVYMNFILKLFQIPTSLHDTSDLTYAYEVLIVGTSLMLKAVRNFII
jgi:hypothetical protein